MKVSGAVDLGMKAAATGLGEPLYGGVGGEEPAPEGRFSPPGYGEPDFGDRVRLPRDEPTASIGRKHCASGLNVLVTSRSAESSWGSAASE